MLISTPLVPGRKKSVGMTLAHVDRGKSLRSVMGRKLSIFLKNVSINLLMLTEFIAKKMLLARYKLLSDGTYFGEIPELKGVWANAKKLELCRAELQSVLEGWLLLKIRDRDSIPGLTMGMKRAKLKQYA